MSTNVRTIEVSRPTGFALWAAIVSVFAAAALIMSAMALIQAGRDSTGDVASASAQLWDAGKLDAMRGRVLAEMVVIEGATLWDAAKLEAMEGRAVAG